MAVAATIAIDIVADQRDAVAAAADTGSAYRTMAAAVEAAGRTASRGMADISASADDMGGKAGRATGALGALASGAELAGPGFEKYGTALGTAALATDFMSGVGDSLNLIMESTILKNVRLRAATIAKAAAEKSAAVATKVMAGAQRALNLAMAANPIGLIVAAIALLVAGLVLAYKKSETFRNIVNTVGEVGKKAIGWVVDRIRDLIDIAGRLIGWFKEKIPGAIDTLSGKVGPVIDALLTPFEKLWDVIQKILDGIGKIDLPDVDLTPWDGLLPGRAVAGGSTTPFVTQPMVHITVNGFVGDEDLLVAKIQRAAARSGRQIGIA